MSLADLSTADGVGQSWGEPGSHNAVQNGGTGDGVVKGCAVRPNTLIWAGVGSVRSPPLRQFAATHGEKRQMKPWSTKTPWVVGARTSSFSRGRSKRPCDSHDNDSETRSQQRLKDTRAFLAPSWAPPSDPATYLVFYECAQTRSDRTFRAELHGPDPRESQAEQAHPLSPRVSSMVSQYPSDILNVPPEDVIAVGGRLMKS